MDTPPEFSKRPGYKNQALEALEAKQIRKGKSPKRVQFADATDEKKETSVARTPSRSSADPIAQKLREVKQAYLT